MGKGNLQNPRIHVLSKVRNNWKCIINNNKVYSSLNKQIVTCNVYVTQVIEYQKGSMNIYDLLVGADEITSHAKWKAKLRDSTENEWKTYHSYITRGARWLSGRVSDSGARGPGFETYRRRVVSLSKTLYSPKVLVNYPGSDGSVPI